MGFLNNNGLSRVWGKIKNLVATKQDKLYIHKIELYNMGEDGDGVYLSVISRTSTPINDYNSFKNLLANQYVVCDYDDEDSGIYYCGVIEWSSDLFTVRYGEGLAKAYNSTSGGTYYDKVFPL